MKFEVLKQSHLKRNIVLGAVAVLIISTIILTFTRAKYRVTESIPLVNGTINYSLADLNIVALYIDGVETTELDSTKSYVLDTTQSTCTYKDGTTIDNLTLSYNSFTKQLNISPFTKKGTKCTLYFEESSCGPACQVILANSTFGTGTPNFNHSSCSARSNNGENCDEETVGVYETTTSLGTTYYWRGDVKDNYLIFADKYWRIIRINEDGSVRIIYSGEKSKIDATGKETVLANGYDDTDTSYLTIESSAFNSTRAGNYYVGYTYIEGYQRPSLAPNIEEEQDSTIKEILDSWYNTNIGNNSNYDSKVVNTPGFCNDRELVSTSLTLYKAYERIFSTHDPIFDCNNINDLYQIKVGLITADEASFAGGKGQSGNSGYYLYIGNTFWTISPSDFYGNLAWIFSINYNGTIAQYTSADQLGIRPVINLSADVTISSGDGTINNPYVITEN